MLNINRTIVCLLCAVSLLGARSVAEAPIPTTASLLAPNYAKGPQMDAMRRWKRIPVKVFFETGGSAYAEKSRQAALAGFDTWTKTTNGVLTYRVVDSAKQADVVVRFHPGDYLPGKPATVGQTYSAVRGNYLAMAVMDYGQPGHLPHR